MREHYNNEASVRRRMFVVAALTGIAALKGVEAACYFKPDRSEVIQEGVQSSGNAFLQGAAEQQATDRFNDLVWDGTIAGGAGLAALILYSVGCRRPKTRAPRPFVSPPPPSYESLKFPPPPDPDEPSSSSPAEPSEPNPLKARRRWRWLRD